MKQQLRKPENWQDFEELCQILWGEIWQCDEIKRNGRNGQNQAGVDIYGVPKGENTYFGIQCKGKDDYTNSQLSTKEIDNEIEKAKNFKPALKKLYFATTSNKDVFIEEYVRLKDTESRNSELFEIHIFCWEDIVNLIDRNQRTYNWYVRKINFNTRYSIDISFSDGTKELNLEPPLVKNYIRQEPVKPVKSDKEDTNLLKTFQLEKYRTFDPLYVDLSPIDQHNEIKTKVEIAREAQQYHPYINGTQFNMSSCLFAIRGINNGN